MKLKQPITKTYLITVSVGSDIAEKHPNYIYNYDSREGFADSRAGYNEPERVVFDAAESWSKEVKPLTNDDTRDLTIGIMEHLIETFGWDKTDQPEEVWYPFKLQDDINDIANKALNIKE